MAIEFARSHVLSRSAGHTAVKAAAYRAGEKLKDERTGLTADYSHRASDVGHSEILLPESADQKMSDRETLWAAVEEREDQHNRHASARLAVDNIIALPADVSQEHQVKMAKAFAQKEFVSKGLVVDMAIHYHSEGNPHAHLMTTTRPLVGDSFGAKDREVAGKFYGGVKIADEVQLRHRWADFQNSYFNEHDIDMSVTNHKGEYQAEVHLGAANAMEKRGIETEKFEKVAQIRSARDQAILENPEIVINRVADKKAVFTRHDLYRELNKVVKNSEAFAEIKPKLDAHLSLVRMEIKGEKEYLTTIDNIKNEHSIRFNSDKLAASDKRFGVADSVVNDVLKDYDFLSKEQIGAVKHLTESNRLGVVMGLAGAGKSTMLEAVRRINEDSGRQIHGVALAGKAADELEKSSGISSRTIASFIYGVRAERIEIKAGDVLAIDEFGMVSSKQAEELLKIAEVAGAKVIAVGDTEQLQSIQAGAALRDLSDRHGYAAIETIRRQSEQWQRDATFDLAKGRTNAAVDAYKKHGLVSTHGEDGAIGAIVSAYLADTKEGTKAVLAHRRGDVKELNDGIRQGLIDAGKLDSGKSFNANTGRDEQRLIFDLELGDEVVFNSKDSKLGLNENDSGTFTGYDNEDLCFVHDDGRELKFSAERYHDIDIADKESHRIKIDLSVGDRILFTRNDRELGVKNGQLGELISYSRDALSVRLDSGETVDFNQQDYSDITHGYATTIHKSQGMTVDRSYLLGNDSMDTHLAYVGMSRHKDSLNIYTNDESKFRYAVSRENRQETALNYAEKNGLELVSIEHSDTIDSILLGEEISDMAVQHVVEQISKEDYQRAKRDLEKEQSLIAARLTEIAKQPVKTLEVKAKGISAEIKRLESEKPKPGLFKTKAFDEKQKNWEHKVNVKTAEHDGVQRQIDSMTSGKIYLESQEKIQKEAARLSTRALPKEASIAKGYQADKQIAELNTKLSSLNKEITRARTAGDEKKLPQLLKSKSNILNSLQNRASLKVRQDRNAMTKISKAVMNTKQELGAFKTRGLSMGR